MNDHTTARHWLAAAVPKAAPALATSTVLILARIWNAQGAEHSVGNAVLMGVLAAGAAAAGGLSASGPHGDGMVTAAAFGTSGALALAGVAAYADGMPLPLLLWAITTTVAYVLAARHWRTDRRDTLAHHRHLTERQAEHGHTERVEAIRAGAQITVARESAAYATALAEAITVRAALPGFNPTTLAANTLPELPTGSHPKEH